MRRLTGVFLALSMFQLTMLDVRTECERHAGAAGAQTESGYETGVRSAAGHEHHTLAADPAPSTPDDAPTRDSVPRCCMIAGACGNSAFARIVHEDEAQVPLFGAATLVAPLRPLSPIRSPEPPPPRA